MTCCRWIVPLLALSSFNAGALEARPVTSEAGSAHPASLSSRTGSAPGAGEQPPLELSGYSWAENLEFDGRGSLYVSDTEEGRIWRIWWTGSAWTQELYFDQAVGVNGLAADEQSLYVCAKSLDGHYQVVRLPLDQAGADPELVVTLPYSGNGLEFDADGLLYATTEGTFLPGSGEVYQIDPEARTWRLFVGDLWAADGIAIDRDRRLMYVTQVVNNKVVVIELPSGGIVRHISVAPPRDHSLLDDIALSADGEYLYGADFGQDRILLIPTFGGSPTVVADGLQAPTSALFGRGPTFNAGSLYVTEGGGLLERDQDQRVLELRF